VRISYRDYKVLRRALVPYISALFTRIQQLQLVPDVWKYGRIILLFKAGDTSLPANFRPICLTNTLGKLFMTMFARSLATWCKDNGVINTSWQKGFMPGVTGTIEHAYRVYGALENAKASGRQIVMTFIDLANAFGSVAHSLILFALARARLPLSVQNLVRDYYTNLRVVIDSGSFQTAPIEQLIGVFQGCPLSPIIFNLCLGPVYDWYNKPQFLPFAYSFKFPPGVPDCRLLGTGYADDISIITNSVKHNQELLVCTDRFLDWSVTLKAKPAKCRCLGMMKLGTCVQRFEPELVISKQPIAVIKADEGFKILGKYLYQDLSLDRQKEAALSKLTEKLERLDASDLTCGQKLTALKFSLTGWIGWELAVYQFSLTWVQQELDALLNRFVKRWLKLPHASNMDLPYITYKQHGLDIPCPSRLFKQLQVSSYHILKYSGDEQVSSYFKGVSAELDQTKKKHWSGVLLLGNLEKEFEEKRQKAAADRAARDEARRGASALATANDGRPDVPDNDDDAEDDVPLDAQGARRKLLQAIKEDESSKRLDYLCSLEMQGVAIEAAQHPFHDLTWLSKLCQVPEHIVRFGPKALLDTLPTRSNLFRWGIDSRGKRCPHCSCIETTLHVLSNCAPMLPKYRWRHNNVLSIIAKFLELRLIDGSLFWVDLPGHPRHYDVFPPSFGVATAQRPDLIVFNSDSRTLLIVELGIPAEQNFSRHHSYKTGRYAELVNELRSANLDWTVSLVASRSAAVACRRTCSAT